jgi:branched-chain amino acid transport system substrate-binding protein
MRGRTTRGILVTAIVVTALVAAACTRASSPGSIRVGAVYPLSGAQGPGGIDEYRGVRLAAQLVNASGGVDGRPIALVPVDVTRGDAAPSAVDELGRQGVRFVVGSYGSTISVPASMEAQRRGMLFWETGAVGFMASAHPTDLVFRVPPTGLFLGGRAVAFVADRLAATWHRDPRSLRFAVAFVDDVYGRSVARGALDEIERRGLDLIGTFGYDARAANIHDVIRRVAAVHPDVLFVAAYVKDGIALRRQVIEQRVPLEAMIGTSSSYCMPAFGAALGRDAVGVFASDKPDEETLGTDGLTASARAVLDRAGSAYRARYHASMSEAALAGFAAAWALFHDVMPSASSLTPDAVAIAARSANVPVGGLPNGSGLRFGAAGTDAADSNLRATSVIEQWTGETEPVVVWPRRFVEEPVRLLPLGP